VIYLDHHATTPVDSRVLEAMLPFFTTDYGNASSRTHRLGWTAQDAVDRARKQVAALMGAEAREVIFTSGATEANHLAIAGVAAASDRRHVVTLVTEHKSVLEPIRRLIAEGWSITELPVPDNGIVDVARVAAATTPDTALVSVMLAHNEIGVIQPIAEIAQLAHARGALLHTDGVQALGKLPVDLHAMGVDLAGFSAHKLYGPKGVGALFVGRGIEKRLRAIVTGGGQERGLRGGTLNVPGIVGFGAACAVAAGELASERERLAHLRDRLWQGLRARVGDVTLNGASAPRLPGNLNVQMAGVEGESLLLGLTDIAVSTGAACLSAEPSHVLRALGLSRDAALASLRFGLGRSTTAEDIDRAVEHVAEVVGHLRATSPTARAAAEARGGRQSDAAPASWSANPARHARRSEAEPR
jgi:cysteine desulfurase